MNKSFEVWSDALVDDWTYDFSWRKNGSFYLPSDFEIVLIGSPTESLCANFKKINEESLEGS